MMTVAIFVMASAEESSDSNLSADLYLNFIEAS